MKKKRIVKVKTKKSKKKVFWFSIFAALTVFALGFVVFSDNRADVLGASTTNQLAWNFRFCNSATGGKCLRSCNSSTQSSSSDACVWPNSGKCCYPKPRQGFPAGGPQYHGGWRIF